MTGTCDSFLTSSLGTLVLVTPRVKSLVINPVLVEKELHMVEPRLQDHATSCSNEQLSLLSVPG